MADPQKYRDDAARLRAEAPIIGEEDLKRQILEITRLYDRLAENIEKRRPTT